VISVKLSSSLSWIGVRPRIFGGFALVLSFLVLLGGFAMVQVGRIGGTVGELVTSAAGDAGMSQVRAALLGANGAVEKFIRTWNIGDKDLATNAIEAVSRLADQAEQRYGKLPAIAEGIAPVRAALTSYRSSFSAAAESVDRLRAATAKTDAHGATAGLDVAGIQVALVNRTGTERLFQPLRLAAAVDGVRVSVMRYGTTLTTADAVDAKNALANAQAVVGATESEIAPAGEAKLKMLVAALKEALTADASALDEVIKVAGDLRARQGDLAKASATIDAEVGRINQQLGAVRAEQGARTGVAVEDTRQTIIVTAVGAVVLGAVLAWLIGASVSGPIRSMTDRMQSLAAGELEQPIPGGEQRDEIGRMARAVDRGAARSFRGRSHPHDGRSGRALRAGHAGRDHRGRRACHRHGAECQGARTRRRARSQPRGSGGQPRRAGLRERADRGLGDAGAGGLDSRDLRTGAALGDGVEPRHA
jgi:HAMP domain-containing protein